MKNPPHIAKENLKYLLDCTDTDNLILKGHILIEHALDYYIDSLSIEKMKDLSRFSYAQKLDITQILGLFTVNDWLKPALQLLNKLRNSIAHNLVYNEIIVRDLLKIYKINSEEVYKLRNEQKIKMKKLDGEDFKISARHLKLMLTIVEICGYIEGCCIGRQEANKEILERASRK